MECTAPSARANVTPEWHSSRPPPTYVTHDACVPSGLRTAIPVFSLRLGFSDESNFADDTSTKQAYDLLVEGFGPGFNRPLILAAELPEGTTPGDLAAITDAAAADPGVEFVSEPRPNDPDAPTAAMWELVPTSGPQDEATTDLVKRLRDEALPPAESRQCWRCRSCC
jgi:putative drug exporter of the RND superfamily